MNPGLRGFLDAAVEKLKKDDRMVGVAVAGSWITGLTDEYSDLDLVIASRDESYKSVLQDKFEIAKSLGHLLSGFTGEHVGEPERLLICLYDRPLLHVDLKFIRPRDLHTRIEDPVVVWEVESCMSSIMSKTPPMHPMPDLQWIEDRFWVWVHYSVAKMGRGELFEALNGLTFFRNMVLGPLSLVRHRQLPRGSRRLESLAPQDLPALIKTTARYDLRECAGATRACVELYRELRNKMDNGSLIRRREAEAAAMKYFDDVESRLSAPA
jgi:predicted nucleotidyltransferase